MGTIRYDESPAEYRNRLLRLTYKCIEKYQEGPNGQEEKQDIMACIILCLMEVEKSVSATIQSWEKRDYWVKAENFIKEWEWLTKLRVDLELNFSNWDTIKTDYFIGKLNRKLNGMKIKSIKADQFWIGCGEKLKTKKGCR